MREVHITINFDRWPDVTTVVTGTGQEARRCIAAYDIAATQCETIVTAAYRAAIQQETDRRVPKQRPGA